MDTIKYIEWDYIIIINSLYFDELYYTCMSNINPGICII